MSKFWDRMLYGQEDVPKTAEFDLKNQGDLKKLKDHVRSNAKPIVDGAGCKGTATFLADGRVRISYEDGRDSVY